MPFPNRHGRPKREVRRYQPLLTVPQAAAVYGYQERTLWQWIEKGALPHVRVGPPPGVIRLRREACDVALTPEHRDRPAEPKVARGHKA